MLGGSDHRRRMATQGGIRVDARIAASRDQFEEMLASGCFGEPLRSLRDMCAVHRIPDRQRLLLHLLPDLSGGQHGIQGRRQLLEERGLLGALLLQFDLLPLSDDGLGVAEFGPVPEDVGVAAHHLLVHLAGDVVEGELPGLGRHLSVQDDMEQQVAQFLPEVGVVLPVDGLQELADLLDQAVADGPVGLFAIPWTTIGGTQPGGGGEEKVDAGHDPMEKAQAEGVKTIARRLGLVSVVGVDKLTEIMDAKRREIAPFARPVTEAELSPFAGRTGLPGFRQSLHVPGRLTVIAEVKRASPSVGTIRTEVNAVAQARLYAEAGAECLSVLTESTYFKGHLQDLIEVVQDQAKLPVPRPCIRKDFMVHPYQVLEAAQAGARCILIIVRGLTDDEIRPIHRAAQWAGLDTLFEVHDEAELERALRHDPDMVGVNNRNLSTFQIDLSFAERVIPQMPAHILKVAESGIKTAEDAARMRAAGAHALLVGESLMRADSPAALLQAFRGR